MSVTLMDGSATIGATEFSLPNAGTTLTPQTDTATIQGWVDVSNVALGDVYAVRVYEKLNPTGIGGTAGSQRLVETFFPVAGQKVLAIPALVVSSGWDVTVQKLSGTDRTFIWSIRKLT